MRAWIFIWLCFAGCEWEAQIAPQQPTIDNSRELAEDIRDEWLQYDRVVRRMDESNPISIAFDETTRSYLITWPGSEILTVTASTMEIEQDATYGLVDLEIVRSQTQEKTHRLALINFNNDRICIWWVMDQKLAKRAQALGLEMSFESGFPFGTTVTCKPQDLLAAVLSNPAAVVGEPECLYRKSNNQAMHESTGGLSTLLTHHMPVPRDGNRSSD